MLNLPSDDHDTDKFTTMALNRGKFEPQMIEARLHDGSLVMYSPCRCLHYSILPRAMLESIHVSNREVVVRPA